jgi:hypothetical protein
MCGLRQARSTCSGTCVSLNYTHPEQRVVHHTYLEAQLSNASTSSLAHSMVVSLRLEDVKVHLSVQSHHEPKVNVPD